MLVQSDSTLFTFVKNGFHAILLQLAVFTNFAMLHYTGSRLKRFVSRGKARTPKDDNEATKNAEKKKRRSSMRSWISDARKSTEEILLRRNSKAIAQSFPLFTSNELLQSPTTSIRSQSRGALLPTTPHSLSGCESPSTTTDVLCPETDALSTDSDDATRWRLIFSPPSSPLVPPLSPTRFTSAHSTATRASTIGLMEALALAPTRIHDNQIENTSIVRDTMTDDISADVAQLSLQVDEAFQAGGFGMTRPDTASPEWHTDDDTFMTATIQSPRRSLQMQIRRAIAPAMSKPNRKKSQVRKHRLLKDPPRPPMRPKSNLKSTSQRALADVADGMSDMFTSIFSSRVGEVRRLREAKLDSNDQSLVNRSLEMIRSRLSVSTDDSLTPVDSFHLHDLPSRLSAAGIGSPEQSLNESWSSIESSPSRNSLDSNTDSTKSESNISVAGVVPRIHLRRSVQSQILPTIHETAPLPSIPARTTTAKKRNKDKGKARSKPGRKALRSTPYSLTSPGFRHGYIQLNRHPCLMKPPCQNSTNTNSQTSLDSEHPVVTDDQEMAMDWTAFQVALNGLSDDFMLTAEDILMNDEGLEEDIDAIVAWWNEYNLDCGQLVRDDGQSEAKTKRAMKIVTGFSDKVVVDEAGTISLPPSPMEHLSPTTLKRTSSFVPMGFNMHHDLPDYLRWKTAVVGLDEERHYQTLR
jgi:hypothetical protein